jgi:hypothetical protein
MYDVLAVIPNETDEVTAAIAEIVIKGSSFPMCDPPCSIISYFSPFLAKIHAL